MILKSDFKYEKMNDSGISRSRAGAVTKEKKKERVLDHQQHLPSDHSDCVFWQRTSIMGQASSQPSAAATSSQKAPPAGCPMHVQNSNSSSPPPASSSAGQCPVPHVSSKASQDVEASRPAACPVGHGGSSSSRQEGDAAFNSSNQMPVLSQHAAPGQNMILPTDRTLSSIPRGNDEGGGVWEYPSPQQFHNALVRKGMETKEEDVEMMVQIHNFLNERAWDEVVRWEKRHNE